MANGLKQRSTMLGTLSRDSSAPPPPALEGGVAALSQNFKRFASGNWRRASALAASASARTSLSSSSRHLYRCILRPSLHRRRDRRVAALEQQKLSAASGREAQIAAVPSAGDLKRLQALKKKAQARGGAEEPPPGSTPGDFMTMQPAMKKKNPVYNF